MTALRAIHAKRRQVPSLADDAAWRGFVSRHTGQASTRNLSPNQSRALLVALDGMGAKKSTSATRRLTGPYAGKIQALWIACWNMGLVKARDDAALIGFVKRQTGLDHASWLQSPRDARAVIEALKSMLARRGVDWTDAPGDLPYMRRPGFRIAIAQWSIIADAPDYASQTLANVIFDLTGTAMVNLDDAGWIVIMNEFGRAVRREVGRKK